MAATAAAELKVLAGILDELDYYQLLEIDTGAASSEIRSAYHRASRRFHPDQQRGLDPELRSCVVRISKRIAEAYSVLRDARRRQAYDVQRSAEDASVRMPLAQADSEADRHRREALEGRTPNGRRYFTLAQAALARGDAAAAQRDLQMALTFEPDNAFFREQLDTLRKR